MKRIKKLKISNFKAFKEEEVFDFDGKNVLIYGNNGAGKSSLFWALYTFLQSSIKISEEEIQKYFKYFDKDIVDTHQSLLNLFMSEDQNSFIEMTSIDDNGEMHTNIISKNNINTLGNETIQELNSSSDFINYKLLHNFYSVSHRQEVNLWSVFERDIFPFLVDDTTVVPWLEIIRNKTENIPLTGSGAPSKGRVKDSFINEINNLNTNISSLLSQIEVNANDFLKDHFFKGEDVVKVSLIFNKKFRYENIKKKLWEDGNDAIRYSELQIKLMVEIFDKNTEEWIEVHRVQSFLNEAQLTRIAIAIRIGALRTRVQNETDFKILVLDDMLNSLDMANRVDIMRIILNKDNDSRLDYFDEFQKIILTHDKGFFDLLQRHTDDEEWVYYKFTKDETTNTAPSIKKELTNLQKAEKYFNDDEFEACGNELRKEGEAVFSNFLDPEMKNVKKEFESFSDKIKKAYNLTIQNKRQKFEQIFSNNGIEIEKIRMIDSDINQNPNLSENERVALNRLKGKLFEYLIHVCEGRDVKESHINNTKEILNRVLNPASHHNDNPLYREELKEAILHMQDIKDLLENN